MVIMRITSFVNLLNRFNRAASFKQVIAWNKKSYSFTKIMKIPSTKIQISNKYE
jgi:hypothetical protein